MSYVVLARRWRPQNFDAVIGQEHVTRTLKNALEQGRVAHAFLFRGPRGVGKTSVARILAKALNCQNGPTATPCNQCQSCQEITQGHSLDVLEIDGASNRGIDEIRELRENIKYLPSHGRYKVYIIDEVHMLTKEAFNALLKTLEEPPAHALFIMATTEAHKVPVTILSRCQRYDFKRLATTVLQEHLNRLALEEGWQLEPEGLQLIAREAEGSVRDALGLLDQVVTFGGSQLSAAEMARILGVTDRALLLKTLTGIIGRDGPSLLALIEEVTEHGLDLKRFYQDLLHYCRNLLLTTFGAEARPLVEVADQEWDQLAALAQQVPVVHLYNLLSLLLQGEEELRRATIPRLSLELLLLRLVTVEPLVDLSDWLARLEALEGRLGEGSASLPRQAAVVAPLERSLPPVPPTLAAPPPRLIHDPDQDPDAAWREFLTYLKGRAGVPLWSKLHLSRLQRRPDQSLAVYLGNSWNLAQPKDEAQLKELLQSCYGRQFDLMQEPPAPSVMPEHNTPRDQSSLDDLKQQALNIFGGQWLPNPGSQTVDKETS